MGFRVRADLHPRLLEPLQRVPVCKLLVVHPRSSSAHGPGHDEQARSDVGVAKERLDAVVEAVVSGDHDRPTRQDGAELAVEADELVGRERRETEPPEQAHLRGEPIRRDIESLLAGLVQAGEPVVVERDVAAPGQVIPFVRRRLRTDARPERRVVDELPGDGEARATEDAARSPEVRWRLEPGSKLELPELREILPRELHL